MSWHECSLRQKQLVVSLAWLASLAVVIAWPYMCHSATLGEDLTRNTIRLSLLICFAAAFIAILHERLASPTRRRLFRLLWTLAWLTYVVHLVMAFHHYFEWSHARALDHTQLRSGWANGIYFSHFFTLWWTVDVIQRWIAFSSGATMARFQQIGLQVFMAFMIFNATVVFETGMTRWAGMAGFTILFAAWLITRARHRLSRRHTLVLDPAVGNVH